MLIRDKVVIVSGIGPGLGVKLAIHAAKEGARAVVVSGRTQTNLDDAEKRVREARADCVVLKQITDICDTGQCQALAKATTDRFGRADALLNNAFAHPDFDRVETSDLDRWHIPFDTNVVGTLRLTQAFLPQMKAQGGGSVVMINTLGSKTTPIAAIAEASYCASKMALWSATRSLATEVGKYQIRVNGIHMGFMWGYPVQNYMRTHPEDFASEKEGYDKVAELHPMKRIVTDDECARAALFLASDYSSAITGAAIDCNGGLFMP
jgi:NAD(P)-dependent dehydrogenase (short-subunit alcohol dehydrogenase family)